MVIPLCHSRQYSRTRGCCQRAMPYVCRPSGPGCGGARHRWLRHRQGLLRPSGPKACKAFASIERTRFRARHPRAEGPSQPLPGPKGPVSAAPRAQGRRPDTSVLRSSHGIAAILRIQVRVRARRRSTRVQHSFHCRRDHRVRVGVPLR